jgi:hypothetical protein
MTTYVNGHPTMKCFVDPPRNDTSVSIGKAAHRCHGWLRCVDGCVLAGPWAATHPVRGGYFKDENGKWRREAPWSK